MIINWADIHVYNTTKYISPYYKYEVKLLCMNNTQTCTIAPWCPVTTHRWLGSPHYLGHLLRRGWREQREWPGGDPEPWLTRITTERLARGESRKGREAEAADGGP